MSTPTGIAGSIGIANRKHYAVVFNSIDLGLCDDVDPTGVKLLFDDITTGSTGKKNVLGKRMVGANGGIKVQFRQLNQAQFAALAPWNVSWTTGHVIMTPPLNSDLYTYSQTLTLHPVENASDTTEDLIFSHACPMNAPGLVKRGGDKDDVFEVEFAVFVDRTALAAAPTSISPGTVG